MKHLALLSVAIAGCGHPSAKPTDTPATRTPTAAAPTTIALPGAPEGGVFLDYLAYDAAHHRVWVPAAGSGRVDVIDTISGALTPIEGWKTQEMERKGQKRLVGPSSVTIAGDVVYVGNRGDFTVCALDAATLARQGCATLDSMPDGLQYVESTKEVWVTTPRDQTIHILDVTDPMHPANKTTLKFDGEPEGFAVDNTKGVFFTNLEDKDKTLVIDLRSHAVVHTWEPACGEDGPKGLVLDKANNHLIVVCADKVEVLDIEKDGTIIGSLAIGDGLDAVDYVPGLHQVFAAAARAEKMVVAELAADGTLTALATIPTAKGARNAVATEDGTAYVAAGPESEIIVVPPIAR